MINDAGNLGCFGKNANKLGWPSVLLKKLRRK